ncbi:MAG TPA: hypothetical protein VKJ01_02645, partial [Candidatus Solibacter sp.]|nr:hypothetical protein [Candidatus Solibacter sp.]
ETVENCLYEAMDLNGLRALLSAIHDGQIQTVAVDTPEPSPFSHEILNANPYAFLDDAPLEERRTRAVQMRRTLPADYAEGASALDPEAIALVASEAWPPTRDADELHEALCGFGVMPVAQVSGVSDLPCLYAELARARRATTLTVNGCEFWVPAERVDLVRRAYPEALVSPPITAPASTRAIPESQEACAAEILRGWFECSGPLRASKLAHNLAMPRELVDQALAQLEAEGQILRGSFSGWQAAGCVEFAPHGETEWCHRRLLARIHQLTIGRLRREIEPVTTAEFYAFLNRWQHLAPGSQLHGVDGTLQIIRQLQGSEFGAAAWESEVLPRRVAHYKPEYLDQLCLAGEVTWGRLSPHPAFEREEQENTRRRVRPTRVAPLAIFLREDAPWLLAGPVPAPDTALSHPAREVLAVLEARGASFFADLTGATGRLSSEVEDALWELVTGGLVTADGFENLWALLDPKRRSGQGKGRTARPRHAPGRWAILRHTPLSPDGNADAFARQLLKRWGVVFRDVAVKESIAPAWRDLLVALRRMESRGEIRGGRFVSAFLGEQFALPEALDLLRAIRRSGQTAAEGPAAWSALPLPPATKTAALA